MKKKTVKVVIGLALFTMAHLLGHTTETKAVDNTTIAVENIVDWNTDGKELALSMSDGSKVYAYRSSDEYGKKRAYIPCKDVISWEVTETGLYITTADGNGYYFEK